MLKKITLLLLLVTTFSFAQEKIGGKIYFDYTYDKDGKPTNEFEIHRVYFTYSNKLSDELSYKVTTDIGRFNTGKDDRMSAYLKNAFVKWSTEFGAFTIGMQGLNIFNVQEKNWGYRYVEKSAMDKYKFASSADLGIGYSKTFNKKIHFSAIVSNGTGYKKSENDDFKKISAQIYYGDSKIKKSGNFNFGAVVTQESFDYVAGSDTTTESKVLFGGFGVYQYQNFRLGAEYSTFNKGGSEISANIFSVYANYAVSPKVDIFARMDVYDPDTDKDDDGLNYIVCGLSIKPVKGLYIAPNIRVTSPEKGDNVTLYKLNFQFKI